MKHIETPEDRFGHRDYPFHLTGEVQESEYLNRLNPIELSYLTIQLFDIEFVAQVMSTPLHVLSVGSSADLQWSDYRDIDLLVCPDKTSARSEFAQAVWKKLNNDPNISVRCRLGSAPVMSDKAYQPFRLKIFPALPAGLMTYFKEFDLAFVGDTEETFDDILAFHQRNDLAFCRLVG